MIACSLLMALGFLGAFIWAMQNGQHDDLYTPSIKILLDNQPAQPLQNDKPKE